jgi:hypothetical protein
MLATCSHQNYRESQQKTLVQMRIKGFLLRIAGDHLPTADFSHHRACFWPARLRVFDAPMWV